MVRIVGPGRAGRSLAGALGEIGWEVLGLLGRDDRLVDAASGTDLLVIATPDAAVAEVAASVTPVEGCVVAHMAGSLGLDVLAPHARRAALHPLVSLPNAELGSARLRAGAWFAVAGDPLVTAIVTDLGGRSFTVRDEHRAAYHAAAAIASNHLVALMGQVERVAEVAGVPREVFDDLARRSLESVSALGPAAALTGPAARGDEATLDRHRAALDASELPAYEAMVDQARRLAAESAPAGVDRCGS